MSTDSEGPKVTWPASQAQTMLNTAIRVPRASGNSREDLAGSAF
jgi:hypothetical protein